MIQATYHFPPRFLWGTATSSHQVEGNNTNNNWWIWEQQPDRILFGHKSGLACDWWNGRWREDFDRAAESGQKSHRLSIEWSRIQPTPDRWDEDALDRYREMLRGLQERGLIPMVTLHHFTDPLWVTESGGWENEAIIRLFEAYVIKVVEALREYSTLWITINEPNIVAFFGYLFGAFPPGKRSISSAGRVLTNMVKAHAVAYHGIHTLQSTAQVGIAHHYHHTKPGKAWFPLDRLAANMQASAFNDAFPRALADGVLPILFTRIKVPEAKGTQDFFGVNYYKSENIAFSLLNPKELFTRRFVTPDADLSDTGWIANEPLGMFEALKWGRQFKLPMFVTENGVEDADDHLRPRYILQHLHQVWRAVNFNFPIKGYFHWSLVDNFEWDRGWTQRFGLWGLDIDTQVRRKRPSVDLYTEICKANSISSEMVARYAPEVFDKIFPTYDT